LGNFGIKCAWRFLAPRQKIVGRGEHGREQQVEVGEHRGPLGSTLRLGTAGFDRCCRFPPAVDRSSTDLPDASPTRARADVTTTQLALITSTLGTLLSALALGPTAALLIATFLVGVLITELARRRP
jgi:hypothetical protein